MPENTTIAVIAPVQPEDYYDLVWQGVWEATFDLASFGVQVENLTTERHDVVGQRDLLRGLLLEDISAIAIMPGHSSALNDLIDEHECRGTKVITFQGDAPASRRSAFVGPDAERSGALAGEVLAKFMGGRGRVLSFPGDQREFRLSGRYAGLRAELARHDGRIQEASWAEWQRDREDAFQAASGIYVGSEDLASVAAVLEEKGIPVPCVGFSNTSQARRLLQCGIVSAIVDEGRHQQGYFAVQKAYEATLKSRVDQALENIHVPSTVAFSANAADLRESLNEPFELLVRQRTEVLCSYKASLEKANAELLSMAITDPLTGLLNRRQFEKLLEQEVARALRYGPMSLLTIDVDLFKAVNDTYGHQAGDEVLKAIAETLKSCTRSTDTCARLGGDEFAIVLPHTDGAAAEVVRQRIVRRMRETPLSVGQHRLAVSVSIGIAALPRDASDAFGLMAASDVDMYRVKEAARAGRGSMLVAG